MNRIIGVAAVVSGIGWSVGLRGIVAPFVPASWSSPASVAHAAPLNRHFIDPNKANQTGGMIVTLVRGACVITDLSLPLLYGECRHTIFAGDVHRSTTKGPISNWNAYAPSIL
jgi:hypothetical protein